MKNDMRITYPLWQMAGILIAMGLVLVAGYSTTSTVSDGQFGFEVSLSSISAGIMLALLGVTVLYLVLFFLRIATHNKRMPERKIQMGTFKPQEYLEDDEMFEEVTKRATKKVYTYFSILLPFLGSAYFIFPIDRTWMITGILLVAAGQYWIFYRTIRKFVAEEE